MDKQLYSALLCDFLEMNTESGRSRENSVFKPDEQSGGLSWGSAVLAVFLRVSGNWLD